jgi:hypothetical protein
VSTNGIAITSLASLVQLAQAISHIILEKERKDNRTKAQTSSAGVEGVETSHAVVAMKPREVISPPMCQRVWT